VPTIASRLKAAEKVLGVRTATRVELDLEQLIRSACGEEPGPPRREVPLGQPTLEELILATRAGRSEPAT
jgi:hypothetical protein